MDILGSQGDFSVSAQRRADLWWVPVALAVLVAIAPVTPGLVERYSAGLYPRIQHALTGVSNLARFPLLDLFSGLLFAAFGLLAARDVTSRGWKRSAAPIARRAAAWGAAVYLAFALVWGLNYRRARLEDR